MDFTPIPGPTSLSILGNMLDLRDSEAPLRALERLASIYGPIFQLTIGGNRIVFIADAGMMKEFMDEKKFMKPAIGALGRPGRPKGVIIAGTDDPDWEQGHRILRPVCYVD
jgi:cytochrome P450/NADPH-cytochrome P450 reductase